MFSLCYLGSSTQQTLPLKQTGFIVVPCQNIHVILCTFTFICVIKRKTGAQWALPNMCDPPSHVKQLRLTCGPWKQNRWVWETATKERERQKHPTQWKCGYFRELPGVPVCPRNDWGLKNVVAVYAERGFAASGRGIFGKHFGPLSLDGSSRLREPDLENCNPDSQSQTLETERRRVITDLNCGEVLSVHQTHLG